MVLGSASCRKPHGLFLTGFPFSYVVCDHEWGEEMPSLQNKQAKGVGGGCSGIGREGKTAPYLLSCQEDPCSHHSTILVALAPE